MSVFRAASFIVLATMCLLGGCKPPQTPLQAIAAAAAAPGTGRTAAATSLVADWNAKRVTLDQAIDLAFNHVDAVRAGTAVPGTAITPTSESATALAGAVLDAVATLEPKLPKGAEAELFWMRVGGLAAASAEEARQAGRGPEALTLVMGGGSRWQTEMYWQRHPTHDGLASLLLAESGDRAQALARLHARADLDGFAAEVYQMLGGR